MKFMEEPLSFKGMAEIQLGNYIIREVCGPPVLVHTYVRTYICAVLLSVGLHLPSPSVQAPCRKSCSANLSTRPGAMTAPQVGTGDGCCLLCSPAASTPLHDSKSTSSSEEYVVNQWHFVNVHTTAPNA